MKEGIFVIFSVYWVIMLTLTWCCVVFVGKGDLFGTDLGYTESIVKSSCDVKSLTYCDLQCILLTGVKEVLLMYQEFGETFAEELVHDLTYNLREGYVDPEASQCTVSKANGIHIVCSHS